MWLIEKQNSRNLQVFPHVNKSRLNFVGILFLFLNLLSLGFDIWAKKAKTAEIFSCSAQKLKLI